MSRPSGQPICAQTSPQAGWSSDIILQPLLAVLQAIAPSSKTLDQEVWAEYYCLEEACGKSKTDLHYVLYALAWANRISWNTARALDEDEKHSMVQAWGMMNPPLLDDLDPSIRILLMLLGLIIVRLLAPGCEIIPSPSRPHRVAELTTLHAMLFSTELTKIQSFIDAFHLEKYAIKMFPWLAVWINVQTASGDTRDVQREWESGWNHGT